jgi:hypothetical protein
VLLATVRSKPGFRDVGFESQTDARTYQMRVADTARLGSHQLTGFGSWERWNVDDGSNFGPNIEDGRTTIWGVGAQDAVTFGPVHRHRRAALRPPLRLRGCVEPERHDLVALGRPTVEVAGLRRKRLPRSHGRRALLPVRRNPDLRPEKSVSAELGVERYIGVGRAEVSLFWNDLKDLIVYEFSTQTNENVGHARTRGVEVGWRQPIGTRVFVDASYTFLDTEDLATGEALLRRPRHRASLGIDWRPIPAVDVYPRVMYVGSRADASEVSGPVTDPAYVRLDFTGRWQATSYLAPYVRVTNALNHQYDEAAGYPAPGILAAGGLDLKF